MRCAAGRRARPTGAGLPRSLLRNLVVALIVMPIGLCVLQSGASAQEATGAGGPLVGRLASLQSAGTGALVAGLGAPSSRTHALEAIQDQIRVGDFKRAFSLAEGAVRRFPRDSEALYLRALALEQLGRIKEAMAGYLASAKAGPDFAAPRNNLGALLLEAGALAQAARALNAAVRVDPAYVDAHANLAVLHERSGDWPAAQSAHRKVLKLTQHATGEFSTSGSARSAGSGRRRLDAHLGLAKALAKQGQTEAARKALEGALADVSKADSSGSVSRNPIPKAEINVALGFLGLEGASSGRSEATYLSAVRHFNLALVGLGASGPSDELKDPAVPVALRAYLGLGRAHLGAKDPRRAVQVLDAGHRVVDPQSRAVDAKLGAAFAETRCRAHVAYGGARRKQSTKADVRNRQVKSASGSARRPMRPTPTTP